MKLLLKLLSYCGLGLTIIPSFLVFNGLIEFETNKILMLLGTLMWFFTVPFWMERKT